jgi:UDP-glucose 6-dehydrogenase
VRVPVPGVSALCEELCHAATISAQSANSKTTMSAHNSRDKLERLRFRAVAQMQVQMLGSAYEAARDAEALVIATEWRQFRDLHWAQMRDAMTRP